MSSYQTFTTTRTTPPDTVAMLATLKTALADPTAVLALVGDTWRGKKATEWTTQQIADAQTILDTTPALTPQVEAQREVDGIRLFDKALVAVLLDEINILRVREGLAERTVTQAITALRNKAGALNGS